MCVKESVTVLCSFHVSHHLPRLPSDAPSYASTSSVPGVRTAGKGSVGLTSTSVEGGIGQTGSLVHGETTLKPQLPSCCEGCPAQRLQRWFVFLAGAKMGSCATDWR